MRGDNADVFPMNALEQQDSDGDGVGDNADASLQTRTSGRIWMGTRFPTTRAEQDSHHRFK